MSEGFMIPSGLDTITEDRPVDPGMYKVEIRTWKPRKSRDGTRDGVEVGLAVMDKDDAGMFSEYIFSPKRGDEPRTVRMMLQNMKRFTTAFGIAASVGEVVTADRAIGQQAVVPLDKEEYERKDGSKAWRNTLKLPRFE